MTNNSPAPILIVEDVPNVLELLEVTLRFKGYSVITAHNGEEALDVIEKTTAIGGPKGAKQDAEHQHPLQTDS